MADFVEGFGKLGDPVKTVGGVDFSIISLTVQQGFVLSRVDGCSSARVLCQISGLGEPVTLEILKELRARGLIVVGDEAPQRPGQKASGSQQAGVPGGGNSGAKKARPARPARPPQLGAAKRAANEGEAKEGAVGGDEVPPTVSQEVVGPPTRSQEMRALEDLQITAEDEAEIDQEDEAGEINLKREIRVRVRALHARVDDLNFFELLGVDVEADSKNVRRAYFKRSKQYHPDRFYTKKCGHYKDKLARIFKQITSAYEFLQEDDKRAEYQQMILREREEERITRKLAKEVARVEGGGAQSNDTPGGAAPPAPGAQTTYSYVKVSKEARKARKRRPTLSETYQSHLAAAGGGGRAEDEGTRESSDEFEAARESSDEFEAARKISDEFEVAREGRAGGTPSASSPTVDVERWPGRSGDNITSPADDEARAARRTADRRRRRRMTGLGEIEERQLKAKGFYEKGIKQLEEGKTLAAAASLKLALTYDPAIPEYRQRYEEAVDASREVTAEGFFKRALFEESVGRVEAAAKLFMRAAEVLDSSLYLTRACEAARELSDLEKALEYGTHAVQKDPGSVAARLAISRVCLAQGDKKRAKHEVEMALKLAPADVEAKDLLKRIKRA